MNSHDNSKAEHELIEQLHTDFLRIQKAPEYIDRFANVWVRLNKTKHRLYTKFFNYTEQEREEHYTQFIKEYEKNLEIEKKWYTDFLSQLRELERIVEHYHKRKVFKRIQKISKEEHAKEYSIHSLKKEERIDEHQLEELKDYLERSRKRIEQEESLLKRHKRVHPEKFNKELESMFNIIRNFKLEGLKIAKKQNIHLKSYKKKLMDELGGKLVRKEQVESLKGKQITVGGIGALIALGIQLNTENPIESVMILILSVGMLGILMASLFDSALEIYDNQLDKDIEEYV